MINVILYLVFVRTLLLLCEIVIATDTNIKL